MGMGFIGIILSWTLSEGRIVACTEVGQTCEPEEKRLVKGNHYMDRWSMSGRKDPLLQ